MTTTPTLVSRDAARRGGLNHLALPSLGQETWALGGKLDPKEPSIQIPAVQVGKPGPGELRGGSRSLGTIQMAPGLTIFSLSMKNQRKLCQEPHLFFAQSQGRKGLYGPPACSPCFLLHFQGSLTPQLPGMRKKAPATAEQVRPECMRERHPQSL